MTADVFRSRIISYLTIGFILTGVAFEKNYNICHKPLEIKEVTSGVLLWPVAIVAATITIFRGTETPKWTCEAGAPS